MTDIIANLEKMTGNKAEKLGKYGKNHNEKAYLVRDDDSDSLEVVHGDALGSNNIEDGDNAVLLASQLVGEPAFAVLKHTNPCGMATHVDVEDLIIDPAVAKKEYSPLGRAFLRAWARRYHVCDGQRHRLDNAIDSGDRQDGEQQDNRCAVRA
ncbi:hypothetical protein HQ545_04000 [Candidatus Woesearchaeota archaeon]|nr:hypothetical protein [Candidatus Woesearchaeota archaeon]